jgi:hypothetical protein
MRIIKAFQVRRERFDLILNYEFLILNEFALQLKIEN